MLTDNTLAQPMTITVLGGCIDIIIVTTWKCKPTALNVAGIVAVGQWKFTTTTSTLASTELGPSESDLAASSRMIIPCMALDPTTALLFRRIECILSFRGRSVVQAEITPGILMIRMDSMRAEQLQVDQEQRWLIPRKIGQLISGLATP